MDCMWKGNLDIVSLDKQLRFLCITFSTLRTEFSLSLLYGLSE
jgi:hypothetical protein